MSSPKELDHFDPDNRKSSHPDFEEYRRHFAGATADHLAVGEASTGYLRSEVAIPGILARYPGARFVVCIRNPTEMAISWHGQMLRTGWESQRDFAAAWRLQAERARGRRVPRLCRNKRDLLYSRVCSLGTQLEALLARVPRSRVSVIVLDDMRDRPVDVYNEVLAFLGVPQDGRTQFPHLNAARQVPHWFAVSSGLIAECKRALGVSKGLGVFRALEPRLARNRRADIPEALHSELSAHFLPEIEKLERILGRSFAAWKEPAQTARPAAGRSSA